MQKEFEEQEIEVKLPGSMVLALPHIKGVECPVWCVFVLLLTALGE
jgi:hypothetical protein